MVIFCKVLFVVGSVVLISTLVIVGAALVVATFIVKFCVHTVEPSLVVLVGVTHAVQFSPLPPVSSATITLSGDVTVNNKLFVGNGDTNATVNSGTGGIIAKGDVNQNYLQRTVLMLDNSTSLNQEALDEIKKCCDKDIR